MISSAVLPANNQQTRLGLAYRVGLVFVLFVILSGGVSGLAKFFVPGKLPDSVSGIIALASVIGAIVVTRLLPKILALKIPFFSRLWDVVSYVMLFESFIFGLSVIWLMGDLTKIYDFWTNAWNNGVWVLHMFMFYYILSNLGYLLMGMTPSSSSFDDDELGMTEPTVNPASGLAMAGPYMDTAGNLYGCSSAPDIFHDSGSSDLFSDSGSGSGGQYD